MSFQTPLALLLLLVVPLLVWMAQTYTRKRHQTAQGFADAHLLPSVLMRGNATRNRLPWVLQLVALGLLFFSGSGPVASVVLPTNKAAVVIALDVSKSMLADDIQPTRLEAAKKLAAQFIALAPATTQIGLVSFSESAAVIVPTTLERDVLREALKRIKPANATSVPLAVARAVRALPERAKAVLPEGLGLPPQPKPNTPNAPNTSKVLPQDLAPGAVLVLSDGVSNSGANPQNQTMLAAQFAKDQNVKIYTVGVGREGGAVTTIAGKQYFVPFDGKPLQQLAQLAGGKYVPKPDLESLREVFKELGTVIRPETQKLELGGPLAGTSLLLLLVAGVLSMLRQRRLP